MRLYYNTNIGLFSNTKVLQFLGIRKHHGRWDTDAIQLQADHQPQIWETKTGRATSRSTVALETNRMLDKIRMKINTHYQEIMDRDNFVTAEKVQNTFLGLEHRCHTLMKVYEQFTADYAKIVEAGMKSKKSYEKYIIVYKQKNNQFYS